MPQATAFSVASFSIVLAESFAAIGLSTIIPNATALAMKEGTDFLSTVMSYASQTAAKNGGKGIADVIKNIADNKPDAITLLVPNKAELDASFSFHANESLDVHGQVGGMIEVVTVKAGCGWLYSEESSNTVKIHVDFAPVEYKL